MCVCLSFLAGRKRKSRWKLCAYRLMCVFLFDSSKNKPHVFQKGYHNRSACKNQAVWRCDACTHSLTHTQTDNLHKQKHQKMYCVCYASCVITWLLLWRLVTQSTTSILLWGRRWKASGLAAVSLSSSILPVLHLCTYTWQLRGVGFFCWVRIYFKLHWGNDCVIKMNDSGQICIKAEFRMSLNELYAYHSSFVWSLNLSFSARGCKQRLSRLFSWYLLIFLDRIFFWDCLAQVLKHRHMVASLRKRARHWPAGL